MVIHYVFKAAQNMGWGIDVVSENKPYLIKYYKDDLYFYTDKFVGIDLNHQSTNLSNDKMLTKEVLKKEGINVIETEKLVRGDQEKLIKLYKEMSKEGQKSLILKPTRGFGGRGVFKVETKEQYLKEEKNIKEEYCVTPFFEHICELRFIIFKRKVEIMHLKYNSETNIIRPKLKKEEKPKITLSAIRKMKNEAIKVAEIMKYDFIAVDYLVAKDDYILLEINLNPSLLKYCDEKEKNEMKCIRFYEKIFDYKEELIRKKSIK